MRGERSARVFQRGNKPRHTQIANIRRFCPILFVISPAFEIFLRLNAPFTAFYMQNVVHACSAASNDTHTHANRNHSSILTKIMRYFSPVYDISVFIRCFHCVMRAERSARVFHHRNKPRQTQIAIILRF